MEGDEILIQEIYSLREKLRISTKIVKYYEPDMSESGFMHDVGTCDYQEYIYDNQKDIYLLGKEEDVILFCNHKKSDYQVLYRNQGVTKDLKYLEDYEIRICYDCKERYKVVILKDFELELNSKNSLGK